MQVTWLGHAAFLVEGRSSTGEDVRVILDPYNYPACGGYLPIDETADIVSVSHENPRYHSDTSAIRGDFTLFRALDHTGSSKTIRGVEIHSFEVYEDDDGNGPNAIVRFALDGITVAHLGDLGHALDRSGLEFLRGTDVLLALAGGKPTIALDDLHALVEKVAPKAVIPMHFKTPKVNLDILPLEAFLDRFEDFPCERPGSATWTVTKDSLPSRTTIVVLEHAR